jgi:hypothetical protein
MTKIKDFIEDALLIAFSLLLILLMVIEHVVGTVLGITGEE